MPCALQAFMNLMKVKAMTEKLMSCDAVTWKLRSVQIQDEWISVTHQVDKPLQDDRSAAPKL